MTSAGNSNARVQFRQCRQREALSILTPSIRRCTPVFFVTLFGCFFGGAVVEGVAGGATVKLDKVAYVPYLAFNLLSLVAAYTRGLSFSADDSNMIVILLDGRLRFEVMDLNGRCLVEIFILMMTISPIPCWFPSPLKIECGPILCQYLPLPIFCLSQFRPGGN